MPRAKKVLTDFDKQVAELYYTPQEAQKILGMSRDTFNNYVRRGAIKRHVLVGTQGFFLKRDIDALAERIELALIAAQTENLIFRKAELSDLPAIDRLAYYHFGEGALTPERKAARHRFLEVNPYSTFCLFDDEKLLASIDIVPLRHNAILEFQEGKRGWQFPNEQIEQFAPGHPLELIIIDMMTVLDAPPRKREAYAGYVLRDISRQLTEWASQGVEVKSIDACGGTEIGRRILTSAGFKYTGEKQPRRHMYHLEVEQSDLKLLQSYKVAIAAWKAK